VQDVGCSSGDEAADRVRFAVPDFAESLETFIPNNGLSVIQFIEVVDEENYVSLPSVRWEKSFRDDIGFPSGRIAWPNDSQNRVVDISTQWKAYQKQIIM